MKAKLMPVYFKTANREEFDVQLGRMQELFADEAEFLPPVTADETIGDVDAIVFPQLVGEAYQKADGIAKTNLPVIALTSEFGTVAMWDWEIITYLKTKGICTLAPYDIELTKIMLRSLALKRELKQTKFVLFQDNPGDGMQADIFKRFYWWEKECDDHIYNKFGVTLEKRSFKRLAEDAKKVSDSDAKQILQSRVISSQDVVCDSLMKGVKMYIALKSELSGDKDIKGAGINCLNESFYSDTTPCLAWQLLFEDNELMWGCEGDTMSLLTQYLIYKTVRQPVMTSNVYPFLIGKAALKHEKIDHFPVVDELENCMLVVHCGYFGMLPSCFAQQWTMRPKVLDIVDPSAMAVDARFPEGNITMVKLHPMLGKIQLVDGVIEEYQNYPGSHCRNGALVRVKDGYKLMDSFYSHHSCLVTGKQLVHLKAMARILDLEVEEQ